MTGPEHYLRAQALEALAVQQWERDQPLWQLTMQQGQLHATLALAAAQIEAVASRGPGDVTQDWREVVGL